MKTKKEIPEGYSDKISKEEFANFVREYVAESTDDEAIEIWKLIAKEDPTTALKAIIKKSEKLDF